MYNKKQNDMNKEFLYMQKLAGLITESEYAAKLNEDENIEFPSWYKSFAEKLSNELNNILKLNDKLSFKPEDLPFKMVDPQLMRLDHSNLLYFLEKKDYSEPADFAKKVSKALKSVLNNPEFSEKGKALWKDNLDVNAKLAKDLPHLENYIYNDRYWSIYIV